MLQIRVRWSVLLLLLATSFDYGHGLQCFKCNSTKTADCAINPTNLLESEECPASDTSCVMAVLDDMVTYRGCSSQLKIPENCEYCMKATCDQDLCNNEIYPEDRIKCHRCQHEECVSVSGPPTPCRNYDSSDFCYVDVIDETDVIRGCVSDDDYDAGVYTVFCKKDGCNNVTAISKFSCLSCDSDKDENCKRGDSSDLICKVNVTNVCSLDLLYGRRESCFTYHDGQRVVRGCSRYDPDLIMQSKYITLCREKDCNSACVTSPSCYVCDSNDDPNCYNDQTALTAQDCPLETSSCFTCKHDDGSITRGCRDNTTVFNPKKCLSCWKNNDCNSGEITTCSVCNSVKDKNCATWWNKSSIRQTACNGTCVVKINDSGYTVRGCESESLKCAKGDVLCKECNSDDCNSGIFPDDRQVCYQCDQADPQCTVDQRTKRPAACPQYSSSDGCFQYRNENGHIIRGCVSEQRYYGCKVAGNTTCQVCHDPSCNYQEVDTRTPLQCHFCRSDENPNCGWAQTTTRDCLPRSNNDSFSACFSYMSPNNTIIRGCMSNTDACDPADVTCELCDKDNCNGENIVYQHCIQCSGELGENICAVNGTEVEPTQCPGDHQFYENRGCYVMYESNIVSRGCLSELSSDEMLACQQTKECIICLEQGCNFQNIISSANQLTSTAFYIYFAWSVLKLI